MKTDTVLNLSIFAGLALLIWWIIAEGRKALEELAPGDNPLGISGESEEDMGPLAWWYYLTSGGTFERYEESGTGDVPWYLDPFDWNPLKGRWGVF